MADPKPDPKPDHEAHATPEPDQPYRRQHPQESSAKAPAEVEPKPGRSFTALGQSFTYVGNAHAGMIFATKDNDAEPKYVYVMAKPGHDDFHPLPEAETEPPQA